MANNPDIFWTIKAMRVYGGSFVQAIGRAAELADGTNLARLELAFPEYWEKYEAMGRELKMSDLASLFPK